MEKFKKNNSDSFNEMRYLPNVLSTAKSNIKAFYSKSKGERAKLSLIAQWDDEFAELHDANLMDKFKEQTGPEFFLNNPMNSEYSEYKDFYKSLLSELQLSIRGDNESEKQLKWAFGSSKEFGNWTKTKDAMIKGRASKQTLKRVNEYENKFKTSFTDSDSEIQSIKKKRVFSDDGAELDIDRVMGGDTNYWSSRKKTGKAKVVRLGIDIGMSLGNTSSKFAKVVGLGIAISKAIQKAGYCLEIYKVGRAVPVENNFLVRQGSFDGAMPKNIKPTATNIETGFKVCLKGSQQNIDTERISNIGLQGVFRGSMFRAEGLAFGHFNGYPKGLWSEQDMENYGLDCVVSNRWVDGQEDVLIQNIKTKLGN